MIFGKKDLIVGLDIGSSTVKAGEIADTGKGQSLKSFAMTTIPAGAIEEGNVRDPGVVADAIKKLFKENGIKEQNVAISIGGLSVIVKKINVATMEETELQETINLEAEQYIPFDISDVNLDFQILGESETLSPLGSIFENNCMVFLDSMVVELMHRLGKNEEEMRKLHATLE